MSGLTNLKQMLQDRRPDTKLPPVPLALRDRRFVDVQLPDGEQPIAPTLVVAAFQSSI